MLRIEGARKSFVSKRNAIVLTVVVAIVLLLALPMREYLRQHAEISSSQQQLDAQQKRVDQMQHEADLWSDDDYVRSQARQRLHFLLPGEVGYQVIQPGQGTNELQAAGIEQGPVKGPWYSKLWDSVKHADRQVDPQAKTTP